MGARAPPQGGEKKLGPNLQKKVVSAPLSPPLGIECTPRGRARVPFSEEIGEIWKVGEVIQVVIASVLRATTKKNRQLFGEEKCTPDKILATLMSCPSKPRLRYR